MNNNEFGHPIAIIEYYAPKAVHPDKRYGDIEMDELKRLYEVEKHAMIIMGLIVQGFDIGPEYPSIVALQKIAADYDAQQGMERWTGTDDN